MKYFFLLLLLYYSLSFCDPVQFTFDTVDNYHLKWSPDSMYFATTSMRGDEWRNWIIPINGDPAYPINDGLEGDHITDWSPDGQHLVYNARLGDDPYYVYLLEFGSETPEMIGEAWSFSPAWSPCGNYIAYMNNNQLKVMDTDGNFLYQATNDSHTDKMFTDWSYDGLKIYYNTYSGNQDIWRYDTQTQDTEQLTTDPALDWQPAPHPNGGYMAWISKRNDSEGDVWIMKLDDGSIEQVTFVTSAEDKYPTWSPDGSKLAFCSDRSGVFNIWIKDMSHLNSLNNRSSIKPKNIMKLGNYPNPFNPETTISFTLREQGNVSCDILNAKGQLVKTLMNKYMDGGCHIIKWDGSDKSGNTVSTGVYFCKVTTADESNVLSIVMMK